MKVTWLGQAGLLFETGGKRIVVDPYLSDSVEKIEPHNKRRIPVDKSWLSCGPDVILLTHNHLDHTDPETLCHYLTEDTSVLVLASYNAWQTVRKFGGLKNNYVMFNRKTRWSMGDIQFEAVYAEHSDEYAVGIIIYAEGKKWYITGDTLYNEMVFADLPEGIDYVFLPVNGRGNNMNMEDAVSFCQRLDAVAIPLHCGLFDDLDMHRFPYEKKIVPGFYKEIMIGGA